MSDSVLARDAVGLVLEPGLEVGPPVTDVAADPVAGWACSLTTGTGGTTPALPGDLSSDRLWVETVTDLPRLLAEVRLHRG